MEWDTLRSALAVALASRSRTLEIRFIGGEPLLEMPLIRRAVQFVEQRRARNREVIFSISTNGVLLDEKAVRFFAEHEFDFQLSFDGVPEAQDIRGRGTFPKPDALLDWPAREHPAFFQRKVHVASTLYSGNLRHLAASIEYFIQKGVPRIVIGPLLTHDLAWLLEDIEELDRQFSRIFAVSLDHFRMTGEVPVDVLRNAEGAGDRHGPSAGAICGAGRVDGIPVDVDGQVTGCVPFAESYQRLPTEFLLPRLDPIRTGN